jgi:hypothetical protein
MARKKSTYEPTERDLQIYANVLANFKKNRIYSFHSWCISIRKSHGNVEKAIKRKWRGKKANQLRRLTIKASKAKPDQLPDIRKLIEQLTTGQTT